ncbi:MAG: type VI secretion system baseplate subunit TssK [Janthinobacterium lividum]
MKLLSHVVWSEGMYLSPLHFQTQTRHQEDTLSFLVSHLWNQPWGFAYLELDHESVRNGTVALVRAAGMLADGLTFDFPASDAFPSTRALSELFAPTDASLLLYLAIPRRSTSGQVVDLKEQAGRLRYSVTNRNVTDETNGTDVRELAFARKNFSIVSEAEINADLVTLPIARVVRDGRGHFFYDPEFIPPCLQIGASDTLMLLLKRLLEGMQEKISTLTASAHRRTGFEAGSSSLDVANYWFLHALSSSAPVLQHFFRTQQSRPEQVFIELSRLAGSLCTFAAQSSVMDLPTYDHLHPGDSFFALDKHIRRHMDIVLPTSYIQLAFSPGEPYFYEADVSDERCLRRARWILGVRSSLGEADLIRNSQRLIKVCSARFVPELVRRALPGLTLNHLPVPPSTIRAEADKQYFSMELSGPCWDHIQQTRRVGVYLPGELRDAEFDLSILVEQPA